jgi:hypothetical protein
VVWVAISCNHCLCQKEGMEHAPHACARRSRQLWHGWGFQWLWLGLGLRVDASAEGSRVPSAASSPLR